MGTAFLMGQGGGAGGARIKSVQRGTITIPVGSSAASVIISSVDLSKAVIVHNGTRGGSGSQTEAMLDRASATLTLVNSTTLRANIYTAASGTPTVVSYMVIEFEGVKSVQRGSVTLSSGGSSTTTVTAVDVSKSMLLHNGMLTQAATNTQRALCTLELTGSTTITITRAGTATSACTVNYSLIEFY